MTGVRAIIHQAAVDADLAASYARMRLRIVANRLRSAGASNQELRVNRELRAAAMHVECAEAVADRIAYSRTGYSSRWASRRSPVLDGVEDQPKAWTSEQADKRD